MFYLFLLLIIYIKAVKQILPTNMSFVITVKKEKKMCIFLKTKYAKRQNDKCYHYFLNAQF